MKQQVKIILSQKISTNQYYTKHYHKKTQIKREIYAEVVPQMKAQLKKIKESDLPLHLIWSFRCSGRQMDIDNFSATIKMLVDSLVHAKIIDDDNPRIIQSQTVRLSPEKSKEPILANLTITPYECSQ